MAVNIIWSFTDGGDPITSQIDLGNASNGQETGEEEIFVRHDGVNDIEDAALYIREFSGTYAGTRTASADLNEILSWADESISADFGGFMVNFNAAGLGGGGAFPTSSWPTYDNKDVEVSSIRVGFVHHTGFGDSEANAVLLPTVTGAPSEGVVPAGSASGVRFRAKIAIPTNEDQIGVRQWDHVLTYNFTS